MQMLTSADDELCEAASAVLVRAHDSRQHRVAVAARGTSGAIYTGLSLSTARVNVCAEPTAIANARMAGEDSVDTIVAVGLDPADVPIVINPCGVCRELVPNFGTSIRVIVSDGGEVGVVTSADLLPIPWVRARSYD